MDNTFIAEVLRNSRMISLEQGMNIYHAVSRVCLLGVPGDVVELGCCHGWTAILIQKTLQQLDSSKILHVFDSFEGLPAPGKEDAGTTLPEGGCKSNIDYLKKNFAKYNTRLPRIHSGWFSDTLGKQLPEQISFAHLDGDFYQAIKESLEEVYPRLAPGALVIVDDYYDPAVQKQAIQNILANPFSHSDPNICPGVKVACDEFFSNKFEKMNVWISGKAPHGYFVKATG